MSTATHATIRDARVACSAACAADDYCQADVWPLLREQANGILTALHKGKAAEQLVAMRRHLGPLLVAYHPGVQADNKQLAQRDQVWADVAFVPWRFMGFGAALVGSGREPSTWSRWIMRGDMPWATDTEPQQRVPLIGERLDTGGLPLCELAAMRGLSVRDTGSRPSWHLVMTIRHQPWFIIGADGVIPLTAPVDRTDPMDPAPPGMTLRQFTEQEKKRRLTQDTALARLEDVSNLELADRWRGVMETIGDQFTAFDALRASREPVWKNARNQRRVAITARVAMRRDLAAAGATADTESARKQAQDAILAQLMDYPEDRTFNVYRYGTGTEGQPRAIRPNDVVAEPGVGCPPPPGDATASPRPPAGMPAAVQPRTAPAPSTATGQSTIQKPPTIPEVEARLKRIGERLALSPATWTKLERSLRCFLLKDPAAPRGIVLHGPPGTGKTTIAKAIAAEAGCAFHALSAPDLKQQFLGASGQKVKDLWDTAGKDGTAIIFIDECDAIFQKRGGLDSDKMTDEIVAAILPRMDGMTPGAGILVIGATNRMEAIDPAIVSRFDLAVPVPLPDAPARAKILVGAFTTYRFDGAPPAHLVNESDGMSGRELEAMVRTARQDVLAGEPADQVFSRAVLAWRARSGAKVDRSLTWDNVVVSDNTRTSLQRCAAMLARREELQKLGLDVMPKGVLLTGPPGTGKTQLARVLAATSSVGFITATTADLKAGFTGQSGQRVKEVFARARAMSPCILFIDEIDIVAPVRGNGGDAFTQEVIGQLLQELDGVVAQDTHVFLMAATNAPNAIDSAILSRFSERIEVPLPTRDQRAQIILGLLKGRPVIGDAAALAETVADRTEGASGRDLKNRIEGGLRRVADRAMLATAGAVGLTVVDLSSQ